MNRFWKSISQSMYSTHGKQKIWILKDKNGGKSEYRYHDPDEEEYIYKIIVDNGIIKSSSGKKADYLLVREESNVCSIVELKGSDLEKACKQIISTYNLLKTNISFFDINVRIILSKVRSPALRSTHMTKLKKIFNSKHGVEYRSNIMSEDKNGIK